MNDSESLLIDAFLDGNLTPEQGEALQHLLRNDTEARATLRRRATIDESLTDVAAAASIANRSILGTALATKDEAISSGDVTKNGKTATNSWGSRLRVMIPWGIACALALVLLANWFTSNRSIQDPEPNGDSFLGLLVDEAGAKFEPGFGPDDVRFDAHEYRLQSGAIHLRLENGADLVMRSPAVFRLDDSFNLELLDGSLRAIVPPSAEGLTIAAPQVNYEDLGTEFGVSVNRESGASRIHVFDGEVNARDAASNRLLSALTSGQSMQFTDDEWKPATAPKANKFLAPGQIGFLRWRQWREQFIKDPSLIAFYSFAHDPDAQDVLANDVSRRATGNPTRDLGTDGTIKGARWVTGRWPGKDALLFDRDDDNVSLSIPGEYDEITLSFWIKTDRLDYEYSALLNSNGWDAGDLHFQIKRTGLAWANVNGRRSSKSRHVGEPLELNRWQHVVCVVSRTEESSRIYINGELVWDQRVRLKNAIAPGTCSLGNWLSVPDQYQPTQRAFKGRMDEVAIWNRLLTSAEIRKLTDAGRPDALWPSEAE